MSDYTPTPAHIEWLRKLIERIKIGGHWTLPSFGVMFEKTDKHTLKLQIREIGISFVPPWVTEDDIDEVLRRTVLVGKVAGIKVILK